MIDKGIIGGVFLVFVAVVIAIVVILGASQFISLSKESYSDLELENAKTQACFKASNCSINIDFEELKVPISGSGNISLRKICDKYGHRSKEECLKKMCNCEKVGEGNPVDTGISRNFGFTDFELESDKLCAGENKITIRNTLKHYFKGKKEFNLTYYLNNTENEGDWIEIGKESGISINSKEDVLGSEKKEVTFKATKRLEPGTYRLKFVAEPDGWNPQKLDPKSSKKWIYKPDDPKLEVLNCNNCYLDLDIVKQSMEGTERSLELKLRLENKLPGSETFKENVKMLIVGKNGEVMSKSEKTYEFESLRDEVTKEFSFDTKDLKPGIYTVYLKIEKEKDCKLKFPKDIFPYNKIQRDSKYTKPIKNIFVYGEDKISDIYSFGLKDEIYRGEEMEFTLDVRNLDNSAEKRGLQLRCDLTRNGKSLYGRRHSSYSEWFLRFPRKIKNYAKGGGIRQRFKIKQEKSDKFFNCPNNDNICYIYIPKKIDYFNLKCKAKLYRSVNDDMSTVGEEHKIVEDSTDFKKKIEIKEPVGVKITNLKYPEEIYTKILDEVEFSVDLKYGCFAEEENPELCPKDLSQIPQSLNINTTFGIFVPYIEGLPSGIPEHTEELYNKKESLGYNEREKIEIKFIPSNFEKWKNIYPGHWGHKFNLTLNLPDNSEFAYKFNKRIEDAEGMVNLTFPITIDDSIPSERRESINEEFEGKVKNYLDMFRELPSGNYPYEICQRYNIPFKYCLDFIDSNEEKTPAKRLFRMLTNKDKFCKKNIGVSDSLEMVACAHFNMTKAMCLEFIGCPKDVVKDWKLLRAGCDHALAHGDWAGQSGEDVEIEYSFLSDPYFTYKATKLKNSQSEEFDILSEYKKKKNYCCRGSAFAGANCNTGGHTKRLLKEEGKGCNKVIDNILNGKDLNELIDDNTGAECEWHNMNDIECVRACVKRSKERGYLKKASESKMKKVNEFMEIYNRTEQVARLCNWFHDKNCGEGGKKGDLLRGFGDKDSKLKVGNVGFTPKDKCKDLGLLKNNGNTWQRMQPCLKFCGCW